MTDSTPPAENQSKEDFLLEIFTEELPHSSLDQERGECRQIFEDLERELISFNINFSNKDFFLTPRRIAVIFREMEGILPAERKMNQGPPLSICFKEGKPSPALFGFINRFPSSKTNDSDNEDKGKGPFPTMDIPKWKNEDQPPGFYRRVLDGTEFLIYHQVIPERKVKDILLTAVPEVLKKVVFNKSMYWGEKQGPFLRPVRSLIALWGKEIIPLNFLGITASNQTRGHRFLSAGSVTISEASSYQKTLYQNKVIVNPAERLQMILRGVEAIEKFQKVRAIEKNKVASIVCCLTEYPTPVYAEVKSELIDIPREVVISEMVEHQMYFPLEDKKGSLLPAFIFTANGIYPQKVVDGNSNVLSSRLSDGIFLFREDIKAGLESLSKKTDKILFEKTLGSYADKCDRITQLALLIKKESGDFFSRYDEKIIAAMSKLIKCDLASGMVYEFPHLQGIMGQYYAQERRDSFFKGVKVNHEMAQATGEHYLPLSAQGKMPTSSLGILLSLSDKLDNLLGLFSVKLIPSGNNDPYALRRQGYGVIRLLSENKIFLSLHQVLKKSMPLYSGYNKNGVLEEIVEFLEGRYKTYAKANGFSSDEIEATFSLDFNSHDRYLKMMAIHENRHTNEFAKLLAGLKRVSNITEKSIDFDHKKYSIINEETVSDSLCEQAEKDLLKIHLEITSYSDSLKTIQNPNHYTKLLETYYQYPAYLDRFFDDVMVNVSKKNLRQARFNLLNMIKKEVNRFFDLSKIKITDK